MENQWESPMELSLKLSLKPQQIRVLWNGLATDLTKHVKIVVSPITGMSKSRIIELYDVHCVYFKNNFNAQDGEPMITLIHLTPAIMIDDGYKVLDHYWKKTDLSTGNVAPTVIKQDEELEIIDMYYEDKEGNKLQSLFYGDVTLVIKTKNGAGKKITLNLNDKNHDFIHEGKELENDLLENISITSDITRVKVKVTPPRS